MATGTINQAVPPMHNDEGVTVSDWGTPSLKNSSNTTRMGNPVDIINDNESKNCKSRKL